MRDKCRGRDGRRKGGGRLAAAGESDVLHGRDTSRLVAKAIKKNPMK